MNTTIDYAYRRFCTKRFPLPTGSQVEALERRINATFPDDYRHFLLEFNGGYFNGPDIEIVAEGCPHDGLRFLRGIGGAHAHAELATPATLVLFDDNDPPKIVPIGGTEMAGLIVLDTAPGDGRGEIYLKQAFGDFYFLAEGIEEFFRLLREQNLS